MNNLMTINQVCDFYQVSRKTVERWMKTGLNYIKLASNNGSVRIKKSDIDMMLEGKNSENPIRRMHWGEYQGKLAIEMDLNDEVRQSSPKVKQYDSLKINFDQDFHVTLNNGNLLINVTSLDEKHWKHFSKDDQENRFKRIFGDGHDYKLLIIFVGFNNNLPDNQKDFDPNDLVNMITVNLDDVTDFNIMQYINQY
ncbi:helix-turn-helix domain-containing protein [Priestia koreensis]|uniref:helix-turn-helix domain-containing protein n=1 Tax=Priestia koreensis TaxID=284581 RepID=UPI001F58E558|nr:helix-turn-helix domain-containing protein [Priestia koreensis]UNL87502.1 helix-turn-helix domain-containing protein [Priestia koreensis]